MIEGAIAAVRTYGGGTGSSHADHTEADLAPALAVLRGIIGS
ncbi:hypothetical protein [Mobilicoccus pelagius]|nr:hypothetical protein [Mobilicoccus pelagius]